MNKGNNIKLSFILCLFVCAFIVCFLNVYNSNKKINNYNGYASQNSYNSSSSSNNWSSKTFSILSSEENKDLEDVISQYAKKNNIDVSFDYSGTLEIMQKLNGDQKYDAIWIANSIWTYMIDTSKVSLKDSKSTSITPIVFGIRKSKAEELGFVGKTVYTKDILDAISSKKLKFAMSNPTTTNSGASAYLGMLYTFAGNPTVLTEETLKDVEVKSKMQTFFSGLERTSGTEDFLEELFMNGDYESVFTYESSVININKKLEEQGKEPLYVVYPMDGVPISDNPFVYVDNKNETKAEIFNEIQKYLLSAEGKKLLQNKGRRTWYGGIDTNVNKDVFDSEWGIKSAGYLNPVKYPTSDVIKTALAFYQEQYRKPIHVVFCLDFSGSMYGEGIKELRDAMEYILSEQAKIDFIQFSEDDIIDIIMFSDNVEGVISTKNGTQTENLLSNINSKKPYGGTALYKATSKGLELLKNENNDIRNKSIILMTDGEGNIGYFRDLKNAYEKLNQDIPIYSIMFGEANSKQLKEIADLTNGKVFDGKTDLVKAFKEVRGYN